MRRQRRTKDEWIATFAAQQASDLNMTEYCAKHDILLKTFSARKCGMNKMTARPTGKLIKVVKPKSQSVSTTPSLTIVYHDVTLNVSQTVEAKWLADVMKALVL